MNAPDTGNVTIDVRGCSRCHGDHDQLLFAPLTHPIIFPTGQPRLTHWATCPALLEPILMAHDETADTGQETPAQAPSTP